MPNIDIEKTLQNFDERYYRVKLPKTDMEKFTSELKSYCQKFDACVTHNENEAHFANNFKDFIKNYFYDEKIYEINTSGYTDLTIRVSGIDNVLIEVKKPTNTNEMISEYNINKKALWEITYYFLTTTRKTDDKKVARNNDAQIKHLLITDGDICMIIDAPVIDKICDGYLEKRFWEYKNNKLTYAKDTDKFYQEIKGYFDKIDITKKLDYIIFSIKDINKKKVQQKYLYKILSKEFLLKEGYTAEIKTNLLNNKFYQELLYIMGLQEIKEKNNVLITIDHAIKNSLANQVYNKYFYDKEKPENEAVEKTFELIIIWINRLLFIKLFEGQLIAFNINDIAYKILDNSKIKNFQDLQNLFFEVLGRRNRRDEKFFESFSEIPYLNSSLFERQPIERDDININELRNEKVVRFNKSVLGKKAPTEIPLLEYIINFLNSYDFSSQETDKENAFHKREIINAAVLGLIFEKLNGYKDGAVYTPSLITEYMCKYAIEKAVINKINQHFGWECTGLDEIKFKKTSLTIAREINEVINTITICDPAVGSGHFLVSALNRVIAIKAQLGVLFKYGTNDILNEVEIFVLDDVLRVVNGQGDEFIYDKSNKLSQQIQETLFNEKRVIIEDMLFGVDINPKAVYICQLRLWIELLKNAYYKNGIMETLPNIDINIKTGNSLLSKVKFEVGKKIGAGDISLENTTKTLIRQYKEAVKQYKSTSDKNDKNNIRSLIINIRNSIQTGFIQLSLIDDVSDRENDIILYKNSFEWAFEIPEVLNEDGKFMGFDIVIGNPPYIQLQKMVDEAEKLKTQNYITYTKMGDIYCLFYERGYQLLKKGGILTFITSNKWMRAGYGQLLRQFLVDTVNPVELIDFAGKKIFDAVTVDANILSFEKAKNKGKTLSCTVKEKCLNNLSVYIEQNGSEVSFDSSDSWVILSPIEQSIKAKIEAVGMPLKEWDISINYGIKTGFNDAFIIDGTKKDELIAADPKSAEIIRPNNLCCLVFQTIYCWFFYGIL